MLPAHGTPDLLIEPPGPGLPGGPLHDETDQRRIQVVVIELLGRRLDRRRAEIDGRPVRAVEEAKCGILGKGIQGEARLRQSAGHLQQVPQANRTARIASPLRQVAAHRYIHRLDIAIGNGRTQGQGGQRLHHRLGLRQAIAVPARRVPLRLHDSPVYDNERVGVERCCVLLGFA